MWHSKLEAFRLSDELCDPDTVAALTPYGAEIWPLLREALYASMLQRHSLPTNPRANTTASNRVRGLLGPASVTSLAKLWRNRRTENLFIATDTCLREHDGSLVNIVVDPIRAHLSSSYLIEWQRDTSFAAHRIQRDSLVAIGGYGFSKRRAPTAERLPCYPDLYSLLESNGLREEYAYVESCLSRYARYLRIASSLLKFVEPKRIYMVSAYGPKMRALLKAANSRAIETIEFQHGSIHRYHPAYIFQNRDLTTARDLFPDTLLVFGEYFKELLDTESSPFSLGRTRILGYPFLEKVADAFNRQARDASSENPRPSVLVTSHNSHNSVVVPFILDLARARPDVQFTYKLHPGERPEDECFNKLATTPNICVVSNYQVLVYDLFEHSDVHVSVSSTCSFEALRFGVPSILLDLGDDSLPIADLIDHKTCESVPLDVRKFFSVFDNIVQQDEILRSACLQRSSYFFSRNYQDNLAALDLEQPRQAQ